MATDPNTLTCPYLVNGACGHHLNITRVCAPSKCHTGWYRLFLEVRRLTHEINLLRDTEDQERARDRRTAFQQDRDAYKRGKEEAYAEMQTEPSTLQRRLDHCREWYACRLERLNQWAREELPDALQTRYFNIVANGTASHDEPPTYAQLVSLREHEREELRKRMKCGLQNFRRFGKRKHEPMWVSVSKLYGWGSTRSVEFCEQLGLDPHECTRKEVTRANTI